MIRWIELYGVCMGTAVAVFAVGEVIRMCWGRRK